MTQTTIKKCLLILAGMLSPTQKWDESAIAIYTLAIAKWDDQIAVGAVQWCAVNMEYRPSPVALRKAAVDLYAAQPVPSMGQARRMIYDALNRIGGTTESRIGKLHPLCKAIIAMFGGVDVYGEMLTKDIDRDFPGYYAAAIGPVYAEVAADTLTVAIQPRHESAPVLLPSPSNPREIESYSNGR